MPLQYTQFLWGFEVVETGTPNNKLDFVDSSMTFVATLNAGVYTADEFAAEVQRAMRAANTNHQTNTCAFNYSTLKFTLNGTSTFSLLFDSVANRTSSCGRLLGFTIGDGVTPFSDDETGATSYVSESAVGTAPSLALLWSVAEPLAYHTPVIAQAIPNAAQQTQRSLVARQYVTDGMTVDSVYFGSLRKVQLSFKALSASEQVKMESFLDWTTKFRRFTWQPDKTSVNAMKLVLANPKEISNVYEWLARPEVGYGTLTFYEQVS